MRSLPHSNQLKPIGLVAALALACLSLPVLFGLSHTASFWMWQLMPFNSALGFLGLGVAFAALVLNRKAEATIFAVLVAILGGATLLEYFMHIDFKIDQVFSAATTLTLQEFPGRMSILSSAVFVLLSTALLIQVHGRVRILGIAALCAGASAAVGILSPFGSQVSAQYDIAAAVRMSKASGIGFFIAGAFLLSWTLERLARDKNERFRIVPLLVTNALALVLLIAWQFSIKQHEALVYEDLRLQAEQAEHIFGERLYQTEMAMGRYASRIALLGIKNKQFLTLDSSNYMSQLPSIRRIGITDPDFNVTWSYPESQQAQVSGFNQTSEPARKKAFEDSRDHARTSLSSFVKLKSGEMGCLIAAPLYAGTHFKGSAYASLSIDRLFSDYISDERFGFSVSENGATVFEKSAKTQTIPGLEFHHDFDRDGAHWRIHTSPTKAYVSSYSGQTPSFILGLGILLILLLNEMFERLAKAKESRRDFHARERVTFRRLDNALESGSMAAFSLDFATGEIWRSKNNDSIWGYREPIDKWTMEHVLNCLEDEDKAAFLEKQQLAFSSRGVQVREVRIRRAHDRAMRWLRITSHTAFDDNNVALYSEGVLTDITAEMATALELTTAHNRLQRLVESSGEGIWERNFDTGEITYFDDNCRTLFGFERDEDVTLKQINDLISDADRAKIQLILKDHIARRTPGFQFDFQARDNRNPMVTTWVRARGKIIRYTDGQQKLVSTLRDVSNEIANRKQLEHAVATAQEAVRAKSAFLANMSHEIRTPLNGLIGMTDLLLDTELNSTQRTYAQIAQQSGESLLVLINDVLDISKIEAGKLELETSQLNIASVVENQVDILMAKAKSKGLSLASFISPDVPPLVLGDAGRLGQVFLNLISNAIKFTEVGGVLVTVEKGDGVEISSESLIVKIKDTGIGIAPNAIANLYTPFVQANRGISKTYGGTGLGLSISKKIVEAMGGTVGIESTVGTGSTFWFQIPIRDVAQVATARKVGWEMLLGARVLLIEQDRIISESLAHYLHGFKMQSEAVTTLEAAAEKLNGARGDERYQLVLIGQTPSGSGVEAQDKLRLLTNDQLPPCILILEFGAQVGKASNSETAFNKVISKPVKQSALMGAITSVLNTRRGQVIHEHESAEPAQATTSSKREFKILVADDVSINLMLTQRMLEFLGYRSVTAGNGVEVLELLKQQHFDLILMDCQMPEMDGFEATRAIRQLADRRLREIPIVALTANAMSGDQQLCINAGMNDYLSKPMKKEQLAEKLNLWLAPLAEKKPA